MQQLCATEMAVESPESAPLAKGVTLLEAVRLHLTAEMSDSERGALAEVFAGFEVRRLLHQGLRPCSASVPVLVTRRLL